MTPAEQENLFKRVREKFPLVSAARASGYVAGIVAEAGDRLDIIDEHAAIDRCDRTDYDNGVLDGFLDARGEEVFDEFKWAKGKTLWFRWWERGK